MGMYGEAGSTEAIQGADRTGRQEIHQTSYNKSDVGPLQERSFLLRENLAFALTTGPRPSAMLRIGKKSESSRLSAEIAVSQRKEGVNHGSSRMDRRWVSRWLLGQQVMKGHGSGLVGDLVLGVVGALLGGFLASVLLKIPNAVNGINVTSILVAFVGAVILIALLRAVSGRRRLV